MIRVKTIKARKGYARAMQRARDLLRAASDGTLDPYIAYRQLYDLYCANTPLHDHFRHFFSIPGVEPDGQLRVDDEFREMVRGLAKAWLADNST
jgi:hypothetical protein